MATDSNTTDSNVTKSNVIGANTTDSNAAAPAAPVERAAPGELTVVQDATCCGCGCVCDDIDLTVENNRITAAKHACPLGEAWFLNPTNNDRPACLIEGQPASLEAGYDRAAQILCEAKYPLVYGLSESPCEAQRVAVSITDWIDGTVDSTASTSHGPTAIAVQSVGVVTCTLGEVMNRGDLIIFWGSNPAETHPRHFSKYSLMPTGQFVPGGRQDRTCVVVDVRKTKSAAEADHFLQIKPRSDFEALWTLRALAKGTELDPAGVLETTGVPLSTWQDLMDRMKACKFGALFFGLGVSMTRGKHCNSEAVLALTREMNEFTRFVAKPNREQGNVTGADNVIAWRTGFPFGVNHSRGYPRYNPGEYTAHDILARREADAAMLIGCDPLANFPASAQRHLRSIPLISLDPQETLTAREATVAFTVAAGGISAPGTVYRLDDVPLPLRPALTSSFPSDFEVLTQIENRVKKRKGILA